MEHAFSSDFDRLTEVFSIIMVFVNQQVLNGFGKELSIL